MEISKGHTHILERIKETDVSGNIRTDGGVEGYFNAEPELGKGFRFYGAGIDFGTRMIYTSDIDELTEDGFITRSGSHYILREIECDG